MKEGKTMAEIGHVRSVLNEKFLRLFKGDVSSHVHIVGQIEAQKSPQEEIISATLNGDQTRANALMEWQKRRPLSQTF